MAKSSVAGGAFRDGDSCAAGLAVISDSAAQQRPCSAIGLRITCLKPLLSP